MIESAPLVTMVLVSLYAGLFWWCYTKTLSEEECAEELEAVVVEKLRTRTPE